MIFIRADANEKVGAGHVMRCMTIADALRQCGQRVRFLTAAEEDARLLRDRGQEYLVLHTDYADLEGELPRLLGILEEEKPDFFLADSYFVTPAYLREVRRYVPTGLLDDGAMSGYPADVVINYNISAGPVPCGIREEPRTQYLLGPEYVPLRKEFTGLNYTVRRRAERVLITTGGSDQYNLSARLLRKALDGPETAKLRYTVVSGAYNTHLGELQELADRYENLSVCSNVRDMWRLMGESDLAVSAGGSTMYELSAVGVPILCFSFVDNQEPIVRGFAQRGLVGFGGNYLARGEAMLEDIVRHIAALAADFGLRESYSRRLRELVDGQGALRIAREVCKEILSGPKTPAKNF